MRKKWIWIMALAVGLVCLFAGTAWAEISTNLSVKIEYNKNNKQLVASRTYVDDAGNPVIASDKGYATVAYKYGTKNVVKKTEFLDEKGNPVDCLDGYCTKVCSYSGTTLTKTSYFTAGGDPAMGPDGYSVQKIKYNEKGKHLSTWEYDTEGNPVNLHRITEYMGGNLPNAVRSDSWYDAEDHLADGPEGYARVEYAYSGKNICKTTYYKADGSLYYNPKTHFAIKEEKYEDFKSRELNYYGADGELAAGPEGYATAKYTYFAADVGNEKLTMFYNADGSLYFNQQGYCGFRRRLGKGSRVMEESYYAGDGIRGYCTDGYSRVTTDYTLQGDVSVQRFYDAEDNLMVVPNLGYAMVKNTYKNQRLIQTEYYDENKELIRGKDGYAVAVYRYDGKACPAETAYYDADGKTLVACKDGYARIQYTCDKNKQVIAEQYFNAEGNPVVVRDNADEIHYTWSGNNKASESYWRNGEPVTNEEGYHELRQEFTGDNKLAAQSFLDVKGKLTELQEGYAKIEFLYNTAGKAMAILYYNGNGDLMKAPGKEYAYVLTISQKERDVLEGTGAAEPGEAPEEKPEETEPEEKEEKVKEEPKTGTLYIEYYGTDGKLMNLSAGYASLTQVIDDAGRILSETFYNAEGENAKQADGYDELRYEYNEKGQETRICYYLNGEPMLTPDGIAAICREYDENRNIVSEKTFGADGQPVTRNEGYDEVRFEYNEKNQAIRINYYLNGKPVVTTAGITAMGKEYNAAGLVSKEWYLGRAVKTITTPVEVMSFTDGADGIPLKKLEVGIEPVQDLHGYDHLWADGAGVNRWDEQWQNGYYDMSTGAFISLDTAVASKTPIHVQANTTYRFVTSNTGQSTVCFYDSNGNYISYSRGYGNRDFTTPANTTYIQFNHDAMPYGNTNKNDTSINYPATVTTYQPYSNICPINGFTGANINIAPTDNASDPDKATYSITFPQEAGTVYGGKFTLNEDGSGTLVVDKANIAFYNGEPLPSTWISDRDVYASGTTPTTGAQVVYTLDTPITYPLTTEQITTLLGTNNIWSDTGKILSCEYEVDLSFMDPDSQPAPVPNNKGVYQTAYDYDQSGRVIRETYLDAGGQRMVNVYGYIMVERKYDEAGNLIEEKGIRPE